MTFDNPPQAVDGGLLRCALGRCLKQLRHRADIAQETLAEQAGIDRGHMNTLEAGAHMPTLDTIFKLLPPLDSTFSEFAAEFERSIRWCKRRGVK